MRRHVEEALGAHGVHATLRLTPYAARMSDEDGRMTRYREGCAIATASEPGRDEHSVVVEAWIKP